MPFISIPLKDAKEAEAVPEGEYDLRIVKAEDRKSKKGNDMTAVSIRIEDTSYPNAQLINHFLVYPNKDTPPDQREMRLRDIARFLQLFDCPREGEGFNSEDLNGLEARASLIQEENEDDHNIYNRLVLPRLKD